MKTLALVLCLLACTAQLSAQPSQSGAIGTCDTIAAGGPGNGVPYKGTVVNDDYKVSLTIPKGLTGWGASDTAPFHGFVIYLPSDHEFSGCIDFVVNLRVPLGYGVTPHHGAKVIAGNLPAVKEEATGKVKDVEFTNITIWFSYALGKRTIDGRVYLVTPTVDLGRNRPLFEEFLSKARFAGAWRPPGDAAYPPDR
jgi:hypothetical protein